MKVLHPVGGRSMIGHVLAAVQAMRAAAGRGGGRPPARAGRPPHPGAGARRRARGAGEAGRHRPRRTRGDGGARRHPGRHRPRRRRRHPAAAGREPARLRRRARGGPAGGEHPQRRSWRTRSATAGSSATATGEVEAIVEEKDATREQREIREINTGILAFDAAFLVEALPRIGNDNAKGEYYLTDTVRLAREDGLTVGAYPIDDVAQTEGANDRAQLAELGRELNRGSSPGGCATGSP